MVGAGPVGLTLACELARHGVRVRIIDQNAGPVNTSRAIAIQARTLEIFTQMGVVEPVLAGGHRIHGASMFAEGNRIVHLNFDEIDSPYPCAIDLPQSETERILTTHLEEFGVSVDRLTSLTGLTQTSDSVTALLTTDGREETLQVPYVAGCDGAHSSVRHLLGLEFDGESSPEEFILADARLDWPYPDDEWYLWFHEEGLFTVFPLPNGEYRIIAEAPDGRAPSQDPTFEEVRRILVHRGPKHAAIREPRWIGHFRISHRKVKEYQRGRVFVAGDAAHVHSPAGGQGMNTGVQDAFNLAWKLALVVAGTAPESLLESYSQEREPVARGVLALTDNMMSIATLRQPVSQKIRNRLIPILAGFDIIQQRLINRLAETSITYRGSPIVGQHGRWYASGPLPGDRALDASLKGGRRIFDLLRGPGFTLLLFTAESPGKEVMRDFTNIARYMRDGYTGEVRTWLIARSELEWGGEVALDLEGTAHQRYVAGLPCLYLIRPDGYIGFRSLSSYAMPLLEYLNQIFEPVPRENGE